MSNIIIRDLYELKKTSGEIGIEIELEGRYLPTNIEKYWTVTTDGSLRGEAFEYVLIGALSKNKSLEALTYLDEEMTKAKNVNPSDRCGVHIHLNCQQMTVMQVYTLSMLYYIFENLMMKYCGEDREGNLFCLRLQDAEGTLDAWKEVVLNLNDSNPLYDIVGNGFKYASLNITSLSRYGTLEFRGLRTPRKMTDIHTWINMIIQLRDASKKFRHPREIIESFSCNGTNRFLRDIMGDYFHFLSCPEEEEMMMNAVREIQDIVYTEPLESPKSKKTSVNKYIIANGLRMFQENMPDIPPDGPERPRVRIRPRPIRRRD